MRFLNMWSDFMFKEKVLLELILTTLFFDLFSYYKSHIVFHKKSTNNLFSSFVLHSKAFQDGIIGRNPSSFGSLIKPAKSSWNSILFAVGFSAFTLHIQTDISWVLDIKIMQLIQKLKIIYTFTNTTFINDVRSDKIVLKAKIWAQDEGQDWSPGLIKKLMVTSIPI